MGARVIIACRSLERGNQAIEDIKQACQNSPNLGSLEIQQLDLNSLSLVRESAKALLEKENKIDVLVNNAGVMVPPSKTTADGYESHFGVNHLGHFLFTLLLLPKIRNADHARIVTVSSTLHERGTIDFEDLNWEKRSYSPLYAYNQSKLANILFTRELARRLKENDIDNINVYSLHPGVISSDLGRSIDSVYPGLAFLWRIMGKWFSKNTEQGAQTTIHCAVDEGAGKETGLYYKECSPTRPHNRALKDDDAKKLWDVSVQLTGLENYNPFQK